MKKNIIHIALTILLAMFSFGIQAQGTDSSSIVLEKIRTWIETKVLPQEKTYPLPIPEAKRQITFSSFGEIVDWGTEESNRIRSWKAPGNESILHGRWLTVTTYSIWFSEIKCKDKRSLALILEVNMGEYQITWVSYTPFDASCERYESCHLYRKNFLEGCIFEEVFILKGAGLPKEWEQFRFIFEQ